MTQPTPTLKQRLAALTTNNQPRTDSLVSPSPRSRGFPLPRSPHEFGLVDVEEQYEAMRAQDRDAIDKAVSGVITQAGVDYDLYPRVIVTAAAFPDPRQISYDILLSRILAYLDLYVENDYVVVFLAAGGRHTPSWNWIWKAYRGLSRKYRKNLKRLLIVHPTWFSKMFVSLAGAVISPKFFRKITYVSTLSELARHVPLTQIEIAPAVYTENLKHERTITLPSNTPSSSTFGVPLERLMGPDGEASPLPRVIRDCVEYLRAEGPLGPNLEVEGLFRRSPNGAILRSVREAYDRGNQVTLSQYADPHIAAVLIKKFLRDLPEPIFSGELYPVIARCPPSTGWGVDGLASDPRGQPTPKISSSSAVNGRAAKGHARVGSEAELATVGGWGEGDACVEYIREVLLPAMGWGCRVVLLGYIFHLLHDVSIRSSRNKMDAHNLALCIAPNLVRSNDPIRDVKICTVPPSAGAQQMSAAWNAPGSGAGGPSSTPAPPRRAGTTTLGEIVKICIERYFEIFEDTPDRGEALPVPSELRFESGNTGGIGLGGMSPTASRSSFSGGSSLGGTGETSAETALDSSFSTLDSAPRSSVDIEDDELNEAMLVMSVAPSPVLSPTAPQPPTPNSASSSQFMPVPYATYSRGSKSAMTKSTGALGPSAWSRSPKMGHSSSTPVLNVSTAPASPVMPKHRRTPSSGSTTVSSPYTTGSTSGPASTIRGARSVISIEKKGGRKGSIALGRSGTTAGSGVAAMGVTATGFFERPV
ncbi:Rho GTPase-activating protein 1 [Ceratobasidium sp. AG-Ba]|nr:Rho GTPase-activating protein 1 [Ceratobasidium sp. AG-Ba]